MQTCAQRREKRLGAGSAKAKKSNFSPAALLRIGAERRSSHCAADKHDEIASPHRLPLNRSFTLPRRRATFCIAAKFRLPMSPRVICVIVDPIDHVGSYYPNSEQTGDLPRRLRRTASRRRAASFSRPSVPEARCSLGPASAECIDGFAQHAWFHRPLHDCRQPPL